MIIKTDKRKLNKGLDTAVWRFNQINGRYNTVSKRYNDEQSKYGTDEFSMIDWDRARKARDIMSSEYFAAVDMIAPLVELGLVERNEKTGRASVVKSSRKAG